MSETTGKCDKEQSKVPSTYISTETGGQDLDYLEQLESGDRKSSVKRSVYNIMCTVVGGGLLGIPSSFAAVGWIYGISLLVVITLLACYSGHIIGRILRFGNPERTLLSYQEMGETAFGKTGKYIVYFCAYGGLLFVSTLMLVLARDMWIEIFPSEDISEKMWLFISLLVIFPLIWVRTFNHVAFISFFGMASVLVVVAYVIIASLVDYIGDTRDPKYSYKTIVATSDVNKISNYFVTIFFSLGGAPAFPEICRCLKNPKKYGQVMNVSFGMMLFLYLSTSAVCYMVYGEHLLDPAVKANIVVALPASWGKTMVAVLILIHVIAAYVVVSNPLWRMFEDIMNIDRHGTNIAFVYMGIFRTLMLGVTFFIAILIPFFGVLMGLIGATLVNSAIFILPPLFYMKIFWKRTFRVNTVTRRQFVLGCIEYGMLIFMMAIALLAGYLGTKDAIEQLLDLEYSIF
eukprot:Nk52_evm5s227 gene=Nk52_evmTU5s227